jgi:hypothetical protein
LEFGFQNDGALGATATTGTRGPILDNYRVEVSAANPPAPVISHALIGGQFIFTWPTVSGWQYQVEYKTNLTQAVWQSLGAPLPATGNSLAFTNSLTTAPESYFRVRQQPQ